MIQIGDVLGGALRIDGVLGRGGVGTVYLATDLCLQRRVAVKELSGPMPSRPEAVLKFKAEARALAYVRSDHVAQAYAMAPLGESFWLAMEYVEGSSLAAIIREHLDNDALVPVHRALGIIRQIALGLAAVHRAGLVHRDVKPANVVVESGTGRPVLVDFGLAMEDGGPVTVELSGTASYMAPEQAGAFGYAESVTARADIYSLGVTAFQLLTGRLPYVGSTAMEVLVQHALEDAPLMSTVRPELARLDDAIAQALARNPADRHPSADAFILALDEATMQPPTRGATLAPPPARPAEPLTDAVRILLVDDDRSFRRLTKMLVQDCFTNVQILEAPDGETALSLACVAAPNLVLLDFDMPGLDGIETLTLLRDLPRGNDTRVLVVSGTAGTQEQWRFAVLGVSDFVAKPTSPVNLLNAVESLAPSLRRRVPT